MKRIIWTILLAIPCSIYAQKTTLVVGGTLADCPEFVRENTHMIQGIRVFEIPSNRLIYEATSTSSSFIPRHIEIENAKVGGYRISYSLNPDYSPYQDKYITPTPKHTDFTSLTGEKLTSITHNNMNVFYNNKTKL